MMRYHFQALTPEERTAMRRIYGGMLTALLDFADLPAEEHDQ
jgi:hypothetical protein